MLMGNAQGAQHQSSRADCRAGDEWQGGMPIPTQGGEVPPRSPIYGTSEGGGDTIRSLAEQDPNATSQGEIHQLMDPRVNISAGGQVGGLVTRYVADLS